MVFSAATAPVICRAVTPEPSFEIYEAALGPAHRTLHVSARFGSDDNDGLTPVSPWRSFKPLKALSLLPGDRVYLHRGDIWNEELVLRAKGTEANAVLISHYGEETLAPPRIACPQVDPHLRVESYRIANGSRMEIPIGGFKGLTLRKSSHVKIDGLDFQGGKVGIFIQQGGKRQVGFQIVNCRFFDIAAHPDMYFYDGQINDLSPRLTDGRGDRTFWGAGIFIGGSLENYGYTAGGELVSGFTVADCRFVGCDTGFGTAFYWPEVPDAVLIRRVALLRSTTFGSLQGSFTLNSVAGAYIRDFNVYSGGGFSSTGICGAFLQWCSDIDIVDCAFNGIVRTPHLGSGTACHDAVGLDLEGACTDIRMLRCSFVGNAGAGLLLCNTDAEYEPNGRAKHPNAGISLTDCVFDRNCSNPDSKDFPSRAGQSNFQIVSWQSNATGEFRRNIFIRSPEDAGELSPNLEGFISR
jgi:hypothetical protein